MWSYIGREEVWLLVNVNLLVRLVWPGLKRGLRCRVVTVKADFILAFSNLSDWQNNSLWNIINLFYKRIKTRILSSLQKIKQEEKSNKQNPLQKLKTEIKTNKKKLNWISRLCYEMYKWKITRKEAKKYRLTYREKQDWETTWTVTVETRHSGTRQGEMRTLKHMRVLGNRWTWSGIKEDNQTGDTWRRAGDLKLEES